MIRIVLAGLSMLLSVSAAFPEVRIAPADAEVALAHARVLQKKGLQAAARADRGAAIDLLPVSEPVAPRDRDGIRLSLLERILSVGEASAAGAASPAPSSTAAPPSAPSRRIALVIGNGTYQQAPPLPNPPNDAADVASALRRLGFDVVEGINLDRRAMDDTLRAFGKKLDRADLALFFYAGHGLQVAGKNYLVPIDAKLERPGDLALDAVDIDVVLAQMEAEKRVNLVFLDACRDNPLARSLSRSLGTRSGTVGAGLASVQSGVGTMIAYATQPNNVALDGEGRNSPFTTALLRHIPTPGVDIGTVMRRVRADVLAATRDKQIPWDHSSLVGDVILVPANAATAPAPTAATDAGRNTDLMRTTDLGYIPPEEATAKRREFTVNTRCCGPFTYGITPGRYLIGHYPKQSGTTNGRIGPDGTASGLWIQPRSDRPCAERRNGSLAWGRFVFRNVGTAAMTGEWGYCDEYPTQPWNFY
ncbi:caspase domain-containing protein [Rhodoplanes sp.]|uniref:caspase family protein n=1 Tax=Rhodoplanes sp. TaxID=1968906 RepID=UPI0025FB074E|nr:caspase domain-containing protein [Rhodoplanes sp.]